LDFREFYLKTKDTVIFLNVFLEVLYCIQRTND